jgi:hypothetical protein
MKSSIITKPIFYYLIRINSVAFVFKIVLNSSFVYKDYTLKKDNKLIEEFVTTEVITKTIFLISLQK